MRAPSPSSASTMPAAVLCHGNTDQVPRRRRSAPWWPWHGQAAVIQVGAVCFRFYQWPLLA